MRSLAASAVTPITGWIMSAIIALLMAIPLYVLWHWLGPIYFAFVPALYLNIGYFETAGMLVLVGFFKMIFLPSIFNRAA